MSDPTDDTGDESSGPLICFVPLDAPKTPDAALIRSAWAELFAHTGLELETIEDEGASDGDVVFFGLGDEQAVVAHMPGPIPWTDLEGPCATAWHWPEATETLKGHGAHFIVTIMGGGGAPLARRLMLTALAAATVKASEALAVYWGEGTLVQSAEVFVGSAGEMSPERLPIHLWVELRVFRDEDGFYVYTTGLRPLGAMEIEIRASQQEPQELIDFVYNVGHYLAQNGPVIQDGDTVGGSGDQKIRAHHVPSAWEREGPVLQIDF